MLKRFILASVLAGGALAAGPQAASAAPIGFSPALAAGAAADVTQVQYYYGPPRPYWRRRYYRPYGYYRPRPFYRPYGYGYGYAPRPYYRPFY